MLRRYLVVAILLTTIVVQTAQSWSIDPAKWTVYMLEDFEITPKHLILRIDNYHNNTLTVKFTSFNDEGLIDEGYEPLPNMTWIRFAEKEVTIPPKTKYEIPVTIEVENKTENYNKTWQFFIFADQVAGGDTDGGATFQYDYNLRWTILTPKEYISVNERESKIEFEFPLLWIAIAVPIIILASIIALKAKKRIKVGKDEDDIFG